MHGRCHSARPGAPPVCRDPIDPPGPRTPPVPPRGTPAITGRMLQELVRLIEDPSFRTGAEHLQAKFNAMPSSANVIADLERLTPCTSPAESRSTVLTLVVEHHGQRSEDHQERTDREAHQAELAGGGGRAPNPRTAVKSWLIGLVSTMGVPGRAGTRGAPATTPVLRPGIVTADQTLGDRPRTIF